MLEFVLAAARDREAERKGTNSLDAHLKKKKKKLPRQLDPDSESARKKAEADRLRAAERFMVVGTGEATCGGCGYDNCREFAAAIVSQTEPGLSASTA